MSHAQLIVAHRGASKDAPENTLVAFKLAIEQRADAIEGDFWLTRDGQVVCMHDKDTRRCAPDSPNLVIKDTTFDELRKLDVGRWKDPRFAGERMPTLKEVLDLLPEGMLFYIELKPGPEIVPAVKKIIETSGKSPAQLRIIAFDANVIAEAKKQMPAIKAHWLTGFKKDEKTGEYSPSKPEVLATLERIKADGLDCHAELNVLDEPFVTELRRRKLEVHCWTVDDPKIGLAVKKLGVDSITTNRPAGLRSELGK